MKAFALIALGVMFLIAVLLGTGCSREGVFENPDRIEVITFNAIQGKTGHLATFTIGEDTTGITKRAVLALHDKEVSLYPLYIVFESGNAGLHGLIDLLKNAADVAVVTALPENTEPLTRLWLNFGEGDRYAGFLRITTSTETQYLSIRGSLSQERKNWFLGELAKPAQVINLGIDAAVSYYRDWGLTERLTDSVEIGTTIYTEVVLSRTDGGGAVIDISEFQPDISFHIGSESGQYRMVPRSVAYEDLQSGDVRPYEDTENSFIGRYVVQTRDFGETFSTSVDSRPVDDSHLHIVFFTYVSDEKPEDETGVQGNPQDFIGFVCIPSFHLKTRDDGSLYSTGREFAQPVFGASVTIMSGSRIGEQVNTDQAGKYVFPNIERDDLHLLVEKDLFEPKEVIVYRDRPTTLANGDVPDFYRDRQKNPGTILIGLHWPEEVRFILRQNLVVYDLLYIENPSLVDYYALYSTGMVILNSNSDRLIDRGIERVLHGFAHEIAHAHQDAVVSPNGSGRIDKWSDTPEGRAYAEAREKDWKEFGKADYDTRYNYPSEELALLENAAETCAYWWSKGHWWEIKKYQYLETKAPNRLKWVEMWLDKN